jgi:hypothetical protein
MENLVEYLRGQSPLGQGFFLAIVGFLGVFVVITVFFFAIMILEKVFRAKKEE